MISSIVTAIAGFVTNHWLLLALVGGAMTSAGAAGGAANSAAKTTQKFLDDQLEGKEEKES